MMEFVLECAVVIIAGLLLISVGVDMSRRYFADSIKNFGKIEVNGVVYELREVRTNETLR